MYGFEDIRKAVRNPRSIPREVNRQIHTRFGRYQTNPKGIDVFNQDWDNLVILDACRYDAFEQRYKNFNLDGTLEDRCSLGSATYQFIRANFTDKELHDTVYVSANPWYVKLQDVINSEVHDFINLSMETGPGIDWADEELNFVTPETTTKFARETHERYPNKRLIVHYLQPHHPFIGKIGRKYFDKSSYSLIDIVKDAQPEGTDERLWEAYLENVEMVLSEVANLLPDLQGRSVVTADHGEMLGDRHDYLPTKDYGHHRGIYNDPTVQIPWFVVKDEERKHIEPEPPVNRDVRMDEARIDEHLRNLGYKM